MDLVGERGNFTCACVHTVDGRKTHAAPGKDAKRKNAFKAQCAAQVIKQLVELAEARRARASSQGQQWTMLCCGDFNCPRGPLRNAFQSLDSPEDPGV